MDPSLLPSFPPSLLSFPPFIVIKGQSIPFRLLKNLLKAPPFRSWVISEHVLYNFIFTIHAICASDTLPTLRNANNWGRCFNGTLRRKQMACFSNGSKIVDGEIQSGNIAYDPRLAILHLGFADVRFVLTLAT